MNREQLITFLHVFSVIADSLGKDCLHRRYGDGHNRYLPGFVKSSEDNIGFQQCMKLCFLKTNCHLINYDKVGLRCEMKIIIAPIQTVDDLLESRPGSVYTFVNKTGQSEDEISCAMLKCPPNTRCVKLHDTTIICHPEPCRREDYVLSSKLNFCFKIHYEVASYTEAEQTCNDENATLTVINSAEKKDFLDKQHLILKYPHRGMFLIAGKKLMGIWTLPDNTVLDQSVQWSKVSENYDGPCLVLWSVSGRFYFADSSCGARGFFICDEKYRI